MNGKCFNCGPLNWSESCPESIRSNIEDNSDKAILTSDSSELRLCVDKTGGVNSTIKLLSLSKETMQNFKHTGANFYSFNSIDKQYLIEVLQESIQLIYKVPCLYATTETFMKNLALLRANSGVDVSFSDPEHIDTVFLSLPSKDEMNIFERVSEAIIHESLHNQLTAIESLCALFINEKLRNDVYSPWKGEGRTERGLFHAVYVFSNLLQYWKKISILVPLSRNFAMDRCDEIENQLADSKHLLNYDSLTGTGRQLGEMCLA